MKIKFGGYEGDWNPLDAVPFYIGAALHSTRNEYDGKNPPTFSRFPPRNRLSDWTDWAVIQAYNIPVSILILRECFK
jgi:hypothetical protein